jgi:hypothetical protein
MVMTDIVNTPLSNLGKKFGKCQLEPLIAPASSCASRPLKTSGRIDNYRRGGDLMEGHVGSKEDSIVPEILPKLTFTGDNCHREPDSQGAPFQRELLAAAGSLAV